MPLSSEGYWVIPDKHGIEELDVRLQALWRSCATRL